MADLLAVTFLKAPVASRGLAPLRFLCQPREVSQGAATCLRATSLALLCKLNYIVMIMPVAFPKRPGSYRLDWQVPTHVATLYESSRPRRHKADGDFSLW